jgi:hypothetical protein
MKGLTVSRMCFVSALMFGLLIAWVGAVPAQSSSSATSILGGDVGTGCACDEGHAYNCGGLCLLTNYYRCRCAQQPCESTCQKLPNPACGVPVLCPTYKDTYQCS